MAEDYILVRLDNNIRDKAVLIYDAAKDLITDSGLVAQDGDIQAAAGSVKVGLQTMSSAGEQVTWTNQNSLVTYAPPWHIIDDTNPGGSYDRFYGPKLTVTRFADRSSVVINPVMNVTIPTDIVALAFNFTWPEAQEGVVFEWFNTLDHPAIWRDIRNVSQGTHDEIFPTPFAYRAGNYVFKMYRLDGQPLKVMGNPNNGYAGYDVIYREFTEKPLATQEYVMDHASSVIGAPHLKVEHDGVLLGTVNTMNFVGPNITIDIPSDDLKQANVAIVDQALTVMGDNAFSQGSVTTLNFPSADLSNIVLPDGSHKITVEYAPPTPLTVTGTGGTGAIPVSEIAFANASITASDLPDGTKKATVTATSDFDGLPTKLDANNIGVTKALNISSPLLAQMGPDNLLELGIDVNRLYTKPINGMFALSTQLTLGQNPTGTTLQIPFDRRVLDDDRLLLNPTSHTITLTNEKGPDSTLYFVKMTIASDGLVVDNANYSKPFTIAFVDPNTNQPISDANSGFDLELTFRVADDQPFGTHTLSGYVRAETGGGQPLIATIQHSLSQSIDFGTGLSTRLSIYQVDDPKNSASLSEIYEDVLSRSTSSQASFIAGGDFVSQSFSIGANEDWNTVNQGDVVRIANHWWFDSISGGFRYRRGADGLEFEDSGVGGPALGVVYTLVPSNVTLGTASRNAPFTVTADVTHDAPVWLYVIGWNGTPDAVPAAVVTGVSNDGSYILDPNCKVLGHTLATQRGVGSQSDLMKVTCTAPAGTNNIIVLVGCHEESPQHTTIRAIKAEAGPVFTGFSLSNGLDEEDYAFTSCFLPNLNASLSPTSIDAPYVIPLTTFEEYPVGQSAGRLHTDTITLYHAGTYELSMTARVVNLSSANSGTYGLWLQYSDDDGANWIELQPAVSVFNLSDIGKAPIPIVRSFVHHFPKAPFKLRAVHAKSRLADNIAVVTTARSGIYPEAPGLIISGHKL